MPLVAVVAPRVTTPVVPVVVTVVRPVATEEISAAEVKPAVPLTPIVFKLVNPATPVKVSLFVPAIVNAVTLGAVDGGQDRVFLRCNTSSRSATASRRDVQCTEFAIGINQSGRTGQVINRQAEHRSLGSNRCCQVLVIVTLVAAEVLLASVSVVNALEVDRRRWYRRSHLV